jgi:NADPH:quinone reductase-like Zn-dependent oxidoreductase
MKAFALTTSDQPAALVELPDPEAPAGGALVRIHAASVNGMDVHQANGYLVSMMPHDFPVVIGRDFSGVVEAVGDGRADLNVGDEVMGFIPAMPPLHAGSWAEGLAAGPDVALARKPASLSFEVAAALPLAGATAIDLIDAVGLTEGDTVVVSGATGGVGSFVIQLAARRGATVVATAKGGDQDAYVRSLGASDTVDYGAGEVVETLRQRFPDGIEVLIDVVNREDDFAAISSLVADGGRIATTMGAADIEALAARGVRATNVMAVPTADKLAKLGRLVDEDAIRVKIQETLDLADAGAAVAAFAAGKVGKLVVTMGSGTDGR